MANPFKSVGCAMTMLLAAWSFLQAQTSSPTPAAKGSPAAAPQSVTSAPKPNETSPVLLGQVTTIAATSPSPAATVPATTTPTGAAVEQPGKQKTTGKSGGGEGRER